MWPRRGKTPAKKVEEAKALVAGAGLSDNPDVVYLLLTEVRSMNSRFSYVMGALSILIALFLAHVLRGIV